MSDKERSSRTRRVWEKKLWLVGLAVVFLLVGIFVTVEVLCGKTDDLPKMYIKLNGVSMGEIAQGDKNAWYYGNEVILVDGDTITEYKNVEIGGRGNMTWKLEKKPLKIKFDSKVDVLRLGQAKKWNLLANMLDDSEMRNDLAFKIAEMLGMEYVSHGEFVDVYVDDDYLGLYYITTPVEIGKATVDIRDKGAVLVEVDNAYCSLEDDYYLTALDRNCLVFKDSGNKDEQLVSFEKFQEEFELFEEMAEEGDFEAIKSIVDVESFAKYFLLNEFAGNPDGFFTSFYMYKNGDGDLIHAGPVWDFDGAFGNGTWWEEGSEEELYSPQSFLVRKGVAFSETEDNLEEGLDGAIIVPKLMYYLIDIPEFQEMVKKIYLERLDGHKDEIIRYINNIADYIERSAVADNEEWQKDDFRKNVDYLIWWVERRMEVFSEMYSEHIKLPEYVLEI